MKPILLVGVVVALLSLSVAPVPVSAQTPTSLGTITLSRAVLADGQRLAAGTYQVRLTSNMPKPGAGQSPDAERYVEFVRGGKVVGREVATIVPDGDIKQILDSPRQPGPGTSRVEVLKGDDYVRVWINRGGTHYLIHFPVA